MANNTIKVSNLIVGKLYCNTEMLCVYQYSEHYVKKSTMLKPDTIFLVLESKKSEEDSKTTFFTIKILLDKEIWYFDDYTESFDRLFVRTNFSKKFIEVLCCIDIMKKRKQ